MCKRVEICVAGIEGGLVYVCINMILLMSLKMFISCMPVNQRLATIKNSSESCYEPK